MQRTPECHHQITDGLCRKFCSGDHEGAVAPAWVGITRPERRTVRPQRDSLPVVLKNSADATSCKMSGWAETGPGSDVDHTHSHSVHVSRHSRPEPLLTELLIHPLPVMRFQWWFGGSLII